MAAQKTLPSRKVIVFVDNRELNSSVTEHMRDFDAEIVPKQLEVADYICSDRVACERKTLRDFLSSIFNQRIFKQLKELNDSYERPVLILEGNPELLFLENRTNPNVIRGVLGSIAVDYKIPIIWTHNPRETAAQVFWIANREQVLEKREIQIRSKRRAPSLAHQQEFLVAGLPGISIPCGFDDKNLPVGLQIITPAFTEEKMFRVARMYEKQTDWYIKKPAIIS